jgi:hypothetical protein
MIKRIRYIWNVIWLLVGAFILIQFPPTQTTVTIAVAGALVFSSFLNLLDLLKREWIQKRAIRIFREY